MELRQAHQSVQPFRTQDEYLYAMKEDLAEWLNALYDADITVDEFFEHLENGVIICRHANNVQLHINRASGHKRHEHGNDRVDTDPRIDKDPRIDRDPRTDKDSSIQYRTNVRSGTFQSRDNIANFIRWCRHVLRIPDTLLFETDDLVLRKNERNVVLCLLEVARRGSRFGLPVPVLVQLEQEIDAEIAAEKEQNDSSSSSSSSRRKYPPIKVDMKSLDELVSDVLGRCTCPDQFPMIRVSDGKYKIGDSLTMIFLRILRSHVMVRIGGGWDTLENYLNRHDPCRCLSKSGHGLFHTWNGSPARERTGSTQMNRENTTTFNSDRKKVRCVSAADASRFSNGDSASSSKMTSPSGGNEHLCTTTTTSSSSNYVGPSAVVKSNIDGVASQFPKSVDGAVGNSRSNRKNATTEESSPLPTKRLDSERAIQTNGPPNNQAATGTPRRSVEKRDPELSGSGRRTSPTDSEKFRTTTTSSVRSPRGTNPRQIRSASGTRGRPVRPFDSDGGGVALGTERGSSVDRSASRDRTGIRARADDDVLMIARDGRGLHRVRDFSRDGDVQRSNADDKPLTGSAVGNRKPENAKIKTEKDQKTGSKPSLSSESVVFRRSLSMSLDSKQQDKEGMKLKSMTTTTTTPERKRTASFSSTAEKTSPSVESRATDDHVIESPPLSPTKSEFLLEEYRKLEFGIQKLISDAKELVGIDGAEFRERTSNGRRESEQLEHACDAIQLKSSTAELVSNGNLSASQERVSTVVSTDCGSVSGSSTVISDCSSDVAGSAELCRAAESAAAGDSKYLKKKKRESSNEHLSCLGTEPHSKTPTPVRTASSTGRCPRSTGGRSLSRSRTDGGVEVRRTTTPTRPSTNKNCNAVSGRSRSRTASARNQRKDRETASSIEPRCSSTNTLSSSATEQTMRIKEDPLPRPRHSSVGPGRRRRRRDEEKVTAELFLLDWDENYRRRVLLRKETGSALQRPSTRIPRPLEHRGTVVREPHHRVLEKLKHTDSGIDIHQP